MNLKKAAMVFLGSWGVLLIVSSLTELEMSSWELVAVTGVMAVLILLLYLVAMRGSGKKRSCTVRLIADPAVSYRVDGDWIYKGSDEGASFYIKRGGIYGFQSMKPLYTMKDGKLYRPGETEAVYRVEENKVISCQTGQPEYEML